MKFVKAYNNFFQKYFPNPFVIAVILSFLSFIIAYIFTKPSNSDFYFIELVNYWYKGFFKTSLLAFTIHMMLILVLGHIIALAPLSQRVISKITNLCSDTKSAVVLVVIASMFLSMLNWGLGLVFGAILAKKVGEKFQKEKKALNYPLIVAAAYAGMMVWHGGLSGSATLTVASKSHTYIGQIGVIPVTQTIFNSLNIITTILLFTIIPLTLYVVAKKSTSLKIPDIKEEPKHNSLEIEQTPISKFENKAYISLIFGGFLLLYFIYLSIEKVKAGSGVLSILNLENTNLLLFALAILLHKNVTNFLNAVNEAIGDVSSILIQFPIYFGIMGLVQESGLAAKIASTFIEFSTDVSLPIFTFLSAGILNIFIPSGGGQWQVQAPIIIASANNSGVAIEKLIMAMCYGDQLTNMLQPFWALPLLSITQLKAKDILPYCLFLFLLGLLIYTSTLLLF